MELEFAVDPLFKKASADFDEGGAKGLLLNHLAIDAQGRIVFDSSDNAEDATTDKDTTTRTFNGTLEDEEQFVEADISMTSPLQDDGVDEEIDITALGTKFFPDLTILDHQHICPSLRNFGLGDPTGSMDIPFLKAPEDWRHERDKSANAIGDKSGTFLDENPAGFDDDDDGLLGGYDLPADTGFGEGGEAWARD